MMSYFSMILLLISALLHISMASQCSDLNLKRSTTNNDDNYLILIEKLKSSNIIKVSLMIKQLTKNSLWFLMGASDSSKLTGSWIPFTSADGQVIDCSLPLEQAVTNQYSSLEYPNRRQFTFYWMAPPLSMNSSIFFVATIFDHKITNNKSSLRYIQSEPIEIRLTDDVERYQEVARSEYYFTLISYRLIIFIFYFQGFCDSSPCLNDGTCMFDEQFSYCRCVAPWNGVFCNLRKWQLSLIFLLLLFLPIEYYHLMLGSSLSFSSDFYFNTLNSPPYANLSSDLFTWLNSAFTSLPSNRMYSINFVA